MHLTKEIFQIFGSSQYIDFDNQDGKFIIFPYSQVNLKEMEILELYLDNENFTQLSINFTHSIQTARETILKITKRVGQIIQDKYIDSLVPSEALDWISNMQQEIMFMNNFVPDQNPTNFELNADKEPYTLSRDHWRRFIVGVDQKKEEIPLIVNELELSKLTTKTRKFSITSVLVSQMAAKKWLKKASEAVQSRLLQTNETSTNNPAVDTPQSQKEFSINFVDMSIPFEEDLMENGMRIAYERDQQLKYIQEQVEKKRQLEIKEQQKQLRQIAASYTGKKNFTFDFEGKIIIQSEIKSEKLAPTQYKLGYDINLVEKNQQFEYVIDKQDKIMSKKEKIELKFEKELQKLLPTSNAASQMELIIPNKGVTIIEGNLKKQGPPPASDNYKLMNENEISVQLSNPQLGLKLTKEEYKSIVGKGGFSRDNEKNKEKDRQNSIMSNQNQSINFSILGGQNQSLLSENKQGGFNINTSIASSQMNSGSIRIINENSIDHLLVNDTGQNSYRSQNGQDKLPLISNKKRLATNPNEDFNKKILNSNDWGSNDQIEIKSPSRKLKLPSAQSIHYSLPVLPKNPRERLSSQAFDSSIQSKRLPPPNVGKVIGHQYKGFKF